MLCPGRRGSVPPRRQFGALGGVLLSRHQGRVFRWNQGPPIANGELWICYWLLCNWLSLPYVTHAANKVPRANTGTGRVRTGEDGELGPTPSSC